MPTVIIFKQIASVNAFFVFYAMLYLKNTTYTYRGYFKEDVRMSILKRVISLLLCIVMLTSVLASCDTDDSHNHETSESTTEQPQGTIQEKTGA